MNNDPVVKACPNCKEAPFMQRAYNIQERNVLFRLGCTSCHIYSEPSESPRNTLNDWNRMVSTIEIEQG